MLIVAAIYVSLYIYIPFELASAAEWLVATMLASNDPPLCAWAA